MEKIDARNLSMDGRSMLRKMVVRLRQQSKMPVKDLAAVAGVHVRTVESWLSRARREGEQSLEGEKKRGRPVGACRKLTMSDEMWLRDQIVDQSPDQLKLPFALWSRPAIKALIKKHFDVDMQDRLVGKYLKRWGFTPQRPIKRALEQDPVKVKAWLEEAWPQVLARAQAEGGTILWGDETAVKEDANWVRGFSPRGKTPVLKTPTRWDKLSMISAISARGEVAFKIVEEPVINFVCGA
jgi:transposase